MVNPTGYTALDMIGFTDQGAYSSSDNYVKNDLVHYSGNIWRCLIDDTTGIAPAEGVNWTLFIGEPTNLVERIIAPVETDPATNAWAVGRQIIFNDNLYEVIVAITAGDALVAYEDDPTNANIKLADPVETQLLDLKGNLSNRNLLDNPWFTINQRGIAKNESVTLAGATLAWDRWHCTGTFTYNTDNSITSANLSIFEIIEDGISKFANKMVVVSAIIDGEIVVGTPHLVISSTPASNVFTTVYNNDGVQIILVELTTGHFQVAVIFSSSHTIKAVKLEVGSISTLAMNTAPNYAVELEKCKYYFERIGGTTFEQISAGFYASATLFESIGSCSPKRAIPSITFNGTVYCWDVNHQGSNGLQSNALGSGPNCSKDGRFYLPFTVSGATAGNAGFAQFRDTTSYIDFSADL